MEPYSLHQKLEKRDEFKLNYNDQVKVTSSYAFVLIFFSTSFARQLNFNCLVVFLN